MHIDGSKMADFTCYKWTPVTHNRNNVLLPDVDRVEISELGSGLSDVQSRVEGRDWSEAVKGLRDNDTVALIAMSVQDVGDTMERMRSISKLAEDSSISKEDRLTLQAEMSSLQADLFRRIYRMGLKECGQLSKKTIEEGYLAEIDRYEASCMAVIDRERGRIADGTDAGPFTDNGDGTFSADFLGSCPCYLAGLSYDDTDYGVKVTGDLESLTCLYDECDEKLSFEDFTDQSKLSVMSAEDAAWTTDSLDKRMDELLKKVESISSLYEQLKEREAQGAFTPDSEVPVLVGEEKKLMPNHETPTTSLFVSDIRIIKPKNPSQMVFKIADAFLKDELFEKLGFSDLILNRNPKNPDEIFSVMLI
ncbi:MULTISPECIES: hypothetical protein [Dethiosulfovibrio]|uniref:Flagellin N-terminal domain-containing protein n=2 Tax=Dethiosulfovibrio TaxID=47054 RepID=A0ABS9EU65_9BACT|nr:MULTISPECIES: hypothetical protein [Dethiosulfovibrio]MCF4115166.1 hypothetical protein [Dethiosulfovibrio russensis]MCF4143612.1 hypothetical protein [Dethiosulfovibrio marinus]MCF4146029.1 hypothetical protein [Dethiosulfovibrio acidaminovorans]